MIAPRYTIKRLMIAVAVVALVLALLQNDTFPTLIGLYTLGLGFIAWLPSRGRSRVASVAFLASAAWLNLSLPAEYAFYPVLHNGMMFFLATMIFVPIVPGAGIAWVATHPERRRRVYAALVVIALTALPASMLATRWPFHLAFHLASPALNRLADRVEAGGAVVPGEWAGIYRVWGSMPIPGGSDTVLLIDTDPRGRFGFIRRTSPRLGGVAPREWLGGRWSEYDED